MRDTFEKIKLYLTPAPDYWKLAQSQKIISLPIGPYPISFRDRLYQNHYHHFDNQGLPMFHSKAGKLVHFCTGMCSFSFAHWEEYMLGGGKSHAEKVVKVADYLIDMAESRHHGGMLILDYDSDRKENGISCAMNQGESISVLCRAFAYTNKQKYIDMALKMAIPFQFAFGNSGVSSKLKENHAVWYLEGGKTILNGHIYSLIGLYELSQLTSEAWVKELFDVGAESVTRSVELFDSGYWSWYWLDKPLYIASAMYHNLHVCQLQVLGMLYENDRIHQYALRFKEYARSPKNRIKAGLELVKAKI